MHVIELWEKLRKRFVRRGTLKHGSAPVSMCAVVTFEDLISDCLDVLNSCSTGTALYLLSCLCPDDFDIILNLICLDLSQPHRHKDLPERNFYLHQNSCEDLLSHLWAPTTALSTEDCGRLWLELTRRWLLTCPVDPEYDQVDETGKDRFCQNLRSELVERILRID